MGIAPSKTITPCELRTGTTTYQGEEQQDPSSSASKPILRRFTRIPYAKPPVGPLRFRRPQPLTPRNSRQDEGKTFKDTTFPTDFAPVAPQPIYASNSALVHPPVDEPLPPQDEDCLYLNVWVPMTDSRPEGGWPVQFHIHGGWLQVGNANIDPTTDPFDIFASDSITNRIIVTPTYRLNIFGFAAGDDLTEIAQAEGDAFAGNYGLWDQRMALEWVHANIADFGGNPKLITVGGLSAGAHSAFLQLYYDSFLPADQRIISQVYLWSNALAVQPNPAEGELLTSQLNELCEAVDIREATTLSAKEKVNQLRQLDSKTLIDAIPKLKMHTFRTSTDGPIDAGGFVPPTYLSSVHDGTLATRLAERDVRIMLGEVKDEGELYKLINPPSSRDGLKLQLENYYPREVVSALIDLSVYGVPLSDDGVSKDQWTDIFGMIAGDCQVHASIRGLTHSLLNPPPGSTAVSKQNLFRYRICWRAKCLDSILKPEVGVCHSADTPIWWASGWRAGYTADDKGRTEAFLKPFGKFLEGEKDVGWGGTGEADEVRLFDEFGNITEGVKDDDWTRGLKVWDAVWVAQRG